MLYKFEELAMDFISKLPKVKHYDEFISMLKDLRVKLKKLSKDPYEKKAFELFDLVAWIDSKLEGRPYAEIVREKLDKANAVVEKV